MAIDLEGVPARGRTLRRLRGIAHILFHQGFEAFVDKTPLAPLVTRECRAEIAEACRCKEEKGACPCGHALPLPQRLLNTVIELGPTFIKLGQIASTRPDLIPEEYSRALQALQETVPPFPFAEVRQILEEELGKPPADCFGAFDEKPIASASLSQVHFAVLHDGTEVAVKIQRPGIRAVIEEDLAILRWLARQLARLYPRVRNLKPEAAVEEFGRWTLRELDFHLEGETYDEFRRNFSGQDDVIFPSIYWDYTTSRCLTMERVSGMRVQEVTPNLQPHERHRLARRLAEIELQMLVTDAFFHADLHPGNIFFKADGRIVILDVGMVGKIAARTQDRFLCYWVAIERRQRDRAAHHLLQMASSLKGADLDQFRQRYDAILDQFYGAPLLERSMARTYLDILLAAAECNIVMPPEMMLQAKAVVTAEALDLVLYPDFKFTEEARPIVARELARRATPRRILDRIWGGLGEFILLGETPPAGPVPTNDDLEERRFRREVLKALAYVWGEETDEKLREKSADISRYTSTDYWLEHPEIQALIETGLGLLRLLAMQQERALWASEPGGDNSPDTATQGSSGDATDEADYRAFQQTIRNRGDKGRPWTADACQIGEFWQAEARRFPHTEYWDDKQILQSSMKGGLALLRLFTAQLAQAVELRQRDDEAADPDLEASEYRRDS
ncbi:AarF/ABC1/UbiB kinase family protein [Microbulbifer magnicolonia]|uniref:ABC1 kinase family protein n=1 Tax=Microbulbifer magnicolonia TaxID=3109744 RepID=UPI002B4161DC|nr:AarF/ABC1/UbiB kinase family protein [Microbulbifer sp. GG15]